MTDVTGWLCRCGTANFGFDYICRVCGLLKSRRRH